MIFRRRRNKDSDSESLESAEADPSADERTDEVAEESDDESAAADPPSGIDEEALDSRDWRTDGPWDVSETDLDDDPTSDQPRVDLGSMIITGFAGAELRLQVAEGTQQIVSAMLISGESALELGAYAAPRSGGLWSELRQEMIESATEAGGSASVAEGPFGVELRRLLPVTTPDGEQGYQPSRMWVAEGPRWLLRGIVYGRAALEDGEGPPVDQLLTTFRSVIVRRGDQAVAPGDLLPLSLPEELTPAAADDGR